MRNNHSLNNVFIFISELMNPLNRLLTILFVLLSYVGCLCAHAQPVSDSFHMHYDAFGTKEGLSQGLVRCIMQDKEGFMWY